MNVTSPTRISHLTKFKLFRKVFLFVAKARLQFSVIFSRLMVLVKVSIYDDLVIPDFQSLSKILAVMRVDLEICLSLLYNRNALKFFHCHGH